MRPAVGAEDLVKPGTDPAANNPAPEYSPAPAAREQDPFPPFQDPQPGLAASVVVRAGTQRASHSQPSGKCWSVPDSSDASRTHFMAALCLPRPLA